MKAFQQDNGEISREHHYVLARNPGTGEKAHFAIPKAVFPQLIDALNGCSALLPDGWVTYDLDDRYYGGSEPPELIERWSHNFLTGLALRATDNALTSEV